MAVTREQTLITAFAALESLHAFSAFNPSIMTIRKFAQDDEAVKAIRQGELIAAAFTVVLGWVLSELTDSWMPLAATVLASLGYVAVYEYALAGRVSPQVMRNTGIIVGATVIPGVPPL